VKRIKSGKLLPCDGMESAWPIPARVTSVGHGGAELIRGTLLRGAADQSATTPACPVERRGNGR